MCYDHNLPTYTAVVNVSSVIVTADMGLSSLTFAMLLFLVNSRDLLL